MATLPAYGGQQFPASPGAVPPHRSLWVLWHMHTIQFFFRGLWCSIYLSISHQLHIREMKDSEKWSPCPARAYISLRVWECPRVPPPSLIGGRGSRGGPAAGYRALFSVTGADIAPRTEWDPSVSLLRCQFALGVHHICHFDLFYSLKESTGRDPIAQPVLPEIH